MFFSKNREKTRRFAGFFLVPRARFELAVLGL
jgi:hypothetical protein